MVQLISVDLILLTAWNGSRKPLSLPASMSSLVGMGGIVLGILVWQDFMFACGNYPTWPSMLDSIESEATANLRRLRNHPCLAIFAGNNEDYQIQEQFGLTYNYQDKDPQNWLKTDFPARYIYEKVHLC